MNIIRSHNHKKLRFATVAKILPVVAIFRVVVIFPVVVIFLGALTPGCVQMETLSYDGLYRSGWQHPAEVVRSLKIHHGHVIANVGSKTSYFTFYFATVVGPKGRVYAVSGDPKLNEYVEKRAEKEGYKNIEVIQARGSDLRLPKSGVDLIFNCDSYQDIKRPIAYFSNAQKYLRRNGRVAILAFRPNQGWWAKLEDPTVSSKVVRRDLEAAGYTLKQEFDYLPRQLFLVFSPKSR